MSVLANVLAVAICLLAAEATPSPDVRLEGPSVPVTRWTVVEQNEAFLVIAKRRYGLPSDGSKPFSSFFSRAVQVDGTGVPHADPEWELAAPPAHSFLVPAASKAFTALAAEDSEDIYAVDCRYGGIPALVWMVAPRSVFSGMPSVRGADPWRYIGHMQQAGSSPVRVATDLANPTLASFQGRVLLAGDAGRRSAWVAPLVEKERGTIEGVVLGAGWAPALAPIGDSLFCFAIHREGGRADNESAGSLVAWKSPDAAQWEPWAPGVPLQNVARVDACSEGDMTLLACLTAAPEPRIYVYRLDPEKEGLTELLTVDPPSEGELGRDIAIRLLKGKAYLFWQDNVGEKTSIVIRRLDMAAEGE